MLDTAPLLAPREQHTAILVGDVVIVAGGGVDGDGGADDRTTEVLKLPTP